MSVLAMKMVGVGVETWRKMPKEDKDKIIKAIQKRDIGLAMQLARKYRGNPTKPKTDALTEYVKKKYGVDGFTKRGEVKTKVLNKLLRQYEQAKEAPDLKVIRIARLALARNKKRKKKK